VLSNNHARGNSDWGSLAQGGAIANENGAGLTVTGCTFTANEALGSDKGGRGFGGAIANNRSSVSITGSTFAHNLGQGGNGCFVSSGHVCVGGAVGGAIDNEGQGTLTIASSTFTGNMARAGNGGNGGPGASGLYDVDLGCGGAIANFGTLSL